MCFGGGGKDPYDAYGAGDFNQWKTGFDALAEREIASAKAGSDIAGLGDFSSLQPLRTRMNSDSQANMDAREAERQHLVRLGQIGIDRSFDRFNDDYYNQYRTDYTGYYYPQIDEQYDTARDKLTAALAGRGMLESTVGADALAKASKQYSTSRTNVANESIDAANKLRGQVESAKSNLYSLNESSADPQAVNAQAVGQATALVAPPEYSPIGDLFAGILTPFLKAATGGSQAKTYTSPYSVSTPKKDGSARVVA